MPFQPNVSVIIPTYNAAGTIFACLDSLKEQTVPIEVIIVDDGSTDDTLARIQMYQVKILTLDHQGPAHARNIGAKQATGEILVFVDADMIFDKEFVKRLIEPIQTAKTKGTWTKDELVLNWDSRIAQCWNLEYTHSRTRSRISPKSPDDSPVFRAILKSEFDRVGGFDQVGYTDDWTLSKKLEYKATLAPGALMYHTNPGNWSQVWRQSVWIAKRQYKLGELGRFIALIRATLPISICLGMLRAIRYGLPAYFSFKIWFDLATSWGIITYWFTGKHAK